MITAVNCYSSIAACGRAFGLVWPRAATEGMERVDGFGAGGLRAGLAPRRSSVGSLLALPVADAVTMLVCFAAGRAGQLLLRERDRGADADPGAAGDGLPGDVPAFRPLHAAAAAVAGVRRHRRDRGGGALVRSGAALSAQGEFLAGVGAVQLGAGGAGGAAGAARGQAGGPGAGPLAAADGDRRHRPERARDRGRLRRAQQPSGLPGAGVPRPGAGSGGGVRCGSAGARSRCCRSTRAARSCRAGWASRTWWWRWSSTRCSGARG